jgi:hypothetical protein
LHVQRVSLEKLGKVRAQTETQAEAGAGAAQNEQMNN